MTTKTLRLPDGLLRAIHHVEETEKIEEATAMRKLLRMGFELHTANLYRDGRLSLRDSARRLGLNVYETLDLFLELGVRGNLTASDVLASLKSVSPR